MRYRFVNTTASSAARAWELLEPYWEDVVEAYEKMGLPEPSRVRSVIVDASWHDTCRHFAGMTHDSQQLIVAPELADMPVDTIKAILAHEAGHAVDLARPGELFLRSRDGLPVGTSQRAKVLARQQSYSTGRDKLYAVAPEDITRKVIEAWYKRSKDEVERCADAVAEAVLGHRIGYVGPCLVQSLNRGVRRPIGLR